MSTRSGKRIHNSFHENLLKPNAEHVFENERKTRSKRMKENLEDFSVNILKNKKRVNYVSYPTEDEVGTDSKDHVAKPSHSLRRNTLKEQNMVTTSLDGVEPSADGKKPVRTTRRTRKFTEHNPEDVPETENHIEEVNLAGKSKGKKKIQLDAEQTTEVVVVNKKKTKKKKLKKGRRSGSMIVEDIEPENVEMNKSNMSVDSFHSAAGSPKHLEDVALNNSYKSPEKELKVVNRTFENNDVEEKLLEKPEGRQTRSATRLSTANISLSTPNKILKETWKRQSRAKLECSVDGKVEDAESETLNTINKVSKKRKSSMKDTVTAEEVVDTTFDKEIRDNTFDLEDLETRKSIKNSTFDKIETGDKINTTYEKGDSATDTGKSKNDTTFDKNATLDEKNITYDKETEVDVSSSTTKNQFRKPIINTTFEKSTNSSLIELGHHSIAEQSSAAINATYEKESNTEPKQETEANRSSIKSTTFDKDVQSEIIPETLGDNKNQRKSIHSISSPQLTTEINNTFDKTEKSNFTFDKDKKLDATYDKSSKSSLITLDNSNITLDKSDVSRISITSDDSKDNIVNTTPVLIESSMDESQTTSKLSPKSPAQTPLTPLKREGTFTKDEPEVLEPRKLSRTPTKRMSLPSPGCTPFHTNKSATREPMVLNVTRSIEKSRRSSLAEPLPRTMKVMFCSPVNNPAVVLQQKRKVIKSNLKGSNKSFVFEESEPRAARRKRSYTQGDAEDARAKRKRLAEAQHPAERPARPRTASASGKISASVTPARPAPAAPRPGAPRSTKLPNFAALHQREFDKMESLEQCQERRARRARQLLTPGAGRERTSPRDTTAEPEKSPSDPPKKGPKDQKQKQPQEAKKPETPIKSLPTFKSLNPGYTRFGFKLNLDVNPFSVPSKSAKDSLFSGKDVRARTSLSFSARKDKDNTKPLKELKAGWRSGAAPSRSGNTSRREVAKQAVMREKSFTDKRTVTRSENRTVIKGVRTNRRFELQMRMRNID